MSNQLFITTGMLAGGIGLFLLAVNMITDGLKRAAGNKLKDILGSWTSKPLRGTFMGVAITAIVQSSSAVTVATIGFVNAGLISLYQALGIIFGTNVGTTVTGWLVAMIGFEIKVDAFALPLIGIGMILRLIGGNRRNGYLGTAITGFGLFFIGIDILKDAFEGIAGMIEIEKITIDGVFEVFVFLGVGFLMTVLTQSSSAAIAITLTAATGGLLGLYAAASMVIGANVGTTSTAAISVIGATPNAKRVAAAHVIFNLMTAAVALMILPILFWVVHTSSNLLGLDDIPAVTLALFHTTFNILGLLLMLPMSLGLTKFLQKRFVTQEEIESLPKYLDKNIAASPDLALNALILELTRVSSIVRRMASAVLNKESGWSSRVSKDSIVLEKLANSVSYFITRLEKSSLSDDVTLQISKLLRAQQHLLASAEQAVEISKISTYAVDTKDTELENALSKYKAEAAKFFDISDINLEKYAPQNSEKQLVQVQSLYKHVKPLILQHGASQKYPTEKTIKTLDENSHIRRMVRQMMKAIRDLYELKVNTKVAIDH